MPENRPDPVAAPPVTTAYGYRTVPIVAGASKGVGTSTVAAALGGADRETSLRAPVDVLVCADHPESVSLAANLADLTRRRPEIRRLPPPILVIAAVESPGPRRTQAYHLNQARAHVAAVIQLPHIPAWRGTRASVEVVRAVRFLDRETLPEDLRAYLSAVDQVQEALSGSADRSPGTQRPIRNRYAAPQRTAPAPQRGL